MRGAVAIALRHWKDYTDQALSDVLLLGYFPGMLGEISLYSVELTQAQVHSIFNNGVNGMPMIEETIS